MIATSAPDAPATLLSVPLARPSITAGDIDAVVDVLRGSTLSLGPRLAAFEAAVAARVGVNAAVGVNSGTSGLHACLAALDISPGDEVITTPFSFVASANCVLYQGATPVFVDIEPETLCLDPQRVAAAVTARTRALLPVDVFGQPADLTAMRTIAARHRLAIVEDACEAIGSEHRGQPTGSGVTAAVFAFYPNKQMTTGEGGIVVTDDTRLANVIRSLVNQGRDDNGTWLNHVRLGFNYRLDEMSAALGLSQLRRLDAIIAARSQVVAWYTERLRHVAGLTVPTIAAATTRMSWFVYVIQLDPAIDRQRLMEELAALGIPTRPYFVPIHLQPYYRQRFGYQPGDFPVTERVAATTLALPFFTDMTEVQVDFVCDRLTSLISAARRPLQRHD